MTAILLMLFCYLPTLLTVFLIRFENIEEQFTVPLFSPQPFQRKRVRLLKCSSHSFPEMAVSFFSLVRRDEASSAFDSFLPCISFYSEKSKTSTLSAPLPFGLPVWCFRLILARPVILNLPVILSLGRMMSFLIRGTTGFLFFSLLLYLFGGFCFFGKALEGTQDPNPPFLH